MKSHSAKVPKINRVLGLMSGTSVDGLDIAGCVFDDESGYSIEFFETVSYDSEMQSRLLNAHKLSGFDLTLLENDYSEWTAQKVKRWLERYDFSPQAIGAHGHTIFHRPDLRLTLQILDGALLATKTGIPVVCDFRRADMALGGQGAPLVPIGDRLLFGDYAACVNLGGFANISYETGNRRVAFDVCAANIVLNELAQSLGHDFDESGQLARSGEMVERLYQNLSSIEYYHLPAPKSLGREWVEEWINPLVLDAKSAVVDLLHTYTVHIADQISQALNSLEIPGPVLITGGGAYNTFLIDSIGQRSTASISLPTSKIIDGKEALIFALLAKLRLENQVNVLGSVTGATHDHCAGSVHI